ncbi:MAG: DUF58 domain-containing protein [Bacteroidota bacterium]|nr:DUF58 domain-containing protein [Bacteroidota bacterium]
METTELLKKVRKIEIKTRGLANQIFSGEYHSVFKGRGMSFSEVREYQIGDDVRSIDWNVTARFNHPYVKIFEEERELTVMLLVDVSGSSDFGTAVQMKKDLAIELCAVLAFSAIQNNDKVGVIFFSDVIEKFIPPKKGRTHILRIVRELLDFKPLHNKTNIAEVLRYLTSVIKKRSIAFVISDFMDTGFEDALKISSKKHDVVAIRLYDRREQEIPAVGLMRLFDAETGEVILIDSSKKSVGDNYSKWFRQKGENLKSIFRKSAIDSINIRTDQSYVQPLMNFFRIREKRW